MDPGDALVLFTDGVTERHSGRDFFDEEGLTKVLGTRAKAQEASYLKALPDPEATPLAERIARLNASQPFGALFHVLGR